MSRYIDANKQKIIDGIEDFKKSDWSKMFDEIIDNLIEV